MRTHTRPDSLGFQPEDEIDEVFGFGNPNQARVGCPPASILAAIARRALSIDHPAHEHLANCSPCYRELRALQQAHGRLRTPD